MTRTYPSGFAVAGLLFVFTTAIAPTRLAIAAEAIAKQDTNEPGVTAELAEAKREEGVLTIRLVLRNAGDKPVTLNAINSRNFDSYYVMAGNKKYFILRDSEKTPLAVQADGSGTVRATIQPGGQWTWWAKYPAPPADVKKVSYVTPLTAPFDNVPLKD